jgi:hypothetical protein
MSTNIEELDKISFCDDFVEDGHVDNEMIKYQNDLKLPIANIASFNGPKEPYLYMEFDELEDARAYYNVYARWNGFSIQISHS